MPGDDTVAQPKAVRHTIFGLNPGVAVTLALVSPIIFTIIAYPDSFGLAWNEGRGGFLFAMAFIAAELVGLNIAISKKKLYIVIVLAAITIGYFVALPFGLRTYIEQAAPSFNVSLVLSWTWMWDSVVMSAFIFSSLFVLFGGKWHKIAPAGAIFLAGTAAFLATDAFFPYDTLGPLQFIVPIYLQIDQGVVNFIDDNVMNIGPANPDSPNNPATARGNLLILNGLHGPFALQVFWPSAGVDSMIIFTLVMLAFLLKIDIPRKKKIIYFIIGAFGTASVNVVRITSLSLYALIVTTNVSEWEAFHSVAGMIMFLPWLGVYLAIVMFTEGKIRKRMQAALASSSTAAAVSAASAGTAAGPKLPSNNNNNSSGGQSSNAE
ncbi:MAG TPA: thaumarchaeosortase [Nitrososphaera sp.]|nr:thaumarchaeosortase [Nitrososphaera sp.]